MLALGQDRKKCKYIYIVVTFCVHTPHQVSSTLRNVCDDFYYYTTDAMENSIMGRDM